MNIFILEGDIETQKIDWHKSAKSLDNFRINKMILENCQMFSTALNQKYGKQVAPYKSFNPKHPCCLWVSKSSENFLTLISHSKYMLEEFYKRFGSTKKHKCEDVLVSCEKLFSPCLFDEHNLTILPMAMPNEFQSSNIILSYRKFFASKKRMRYFKNDVPKWFKELRKIPFEEI